MRIQSERQTALCIPVKNRGNCAEVSTHAPIHSPQFGCVHCSPNKLVALIIRVIHSDVANGLSQPCDPARTHLAVMTRCTPPCSWSTSSVQAGGADLSSVGLSVPLDNLLRWLWRSPTSSRHAELRTWFSTRILV